jgi:hypothetical protein
MSNNSYINYDAIKKDVNLDGKKFFAVACIIAAIFAANSLLNLNEKIDSDKKKIDEITISLASLREQVSQDKEQSQQQIDLLSAVTSTNTENITLLAANTNTKVAAVKRSIIAVSNDIAATNNRVGGIEKKTLSIEERTRAIEQAVDMPGANPLDSLITNYNQE